MQQYHDLMERILSTGSVKGDRTGTGTYSVFGHQMRFNLEQGFPLLTTKKLPLKAIIHELLWFIAGDTNIKYLTDNGVSIWNEWADENGDLGPVYGKQWRSWPTGREYEKQDGGYITRGEEKIDQIALVQDQIRNNPNSRRLIVTAWNPAEVDEMALPPCHCLFQFNTRSIDLMHRMRLAEKVSHDWHIVNGKKVFGDAAIDQLDAMGIPKLYLDCQLYQRSADVFLGVPFNIASYALLTMMMAQATGTQAGDFIHTLGDAHLYSNHLEQAALQLSRSSRKLPTMSINPKVKNIFDFKFEDFTLQGYDPHPHIKAEVSV